MEKTMTPAEFAAWKQQSEEKIQRLREEAAEFRREADKFRRASARELAETKRLIKELSKNFGGWANNEGERLENEFAEALAEAKQIGAIVLDEVRTRMKNRFEYDMAGINCDAVVVGEIKRKLSAADVREFAEKRLPHFAADFPAETAGRKIFGMVAGETIAADAENEAEKHGFFVLQLKNKKLVVGNAEGARAVN